MNNNVMQMQLELNIENLLKNMLLIKNFIKKIILKRHFFMPHMRMGQTNFSLQLFKGQLMKLKIVLLKSMTTIFLKLANQ
jgi:hypothetical protein